MSKRVILDTEHLILWYHPEAKIVHHQFNSYVFGDPFRACLDEGIKLLTQHGAQKWLSDDRRNSALPEEDLAWCLDDWLPRAIAAGIKYWGVIVPQKVVGKMNMMRIVSLAKEKGLIVETFATPEDGFKWMERLPRL